MAANVDAMLRAAIEAYRSGKKADARALLDKVLEVDEYNENAWMWMSAAVETADERRTCLENVLVINPNNEKARMGMKSLGFDPDATSLIPPSASSAVFTDTSFTNDDADSGSASVWDDDAPPTASSSASSASFRGADVSSNDLDSWISGMGIGGAPAKQPSLSPAPNPFSASTFDANVDEDDEPGFDEFDDRMDNLFSEDEFDIDVPPTPPAKPSAPVRPAAQASRPASPAFTPPAAFDDDDDDDDLSLFEDDGLDVSDEDFDEFNALIEEDVAPVLPPVRRTSTRPAVSRGSDFAIEEEQEEGEAPDPAQLFAQIPKEIAVAKRLPGESEDTPRPLLIGAVVLFVLNLAALGFLLMPK